MLKEIQPANDALQDHSQARSGDVSPAQGGAAHAGLAHAGLAYAALDLGTNNCRLLVATPSSDGFRVIDSYSRIVRLGEGLHETGMLSEAAMERAMMALHACAARLGRRPMRDVRAIATEACRRAGNGAAFLARVKAETGITFDIITPREEAELALDSCGKLLEGDARRALLFDIGGGSTELGWIRMDPGCVPQLCGYVSLPLGVVTLADQFGPAGFTEAGFEAMVDEVAGRLEGFEAVHCIAQEIRSGSVLLLGTQRHGDDAGGHRAGTVALPADGGGRACAERRGRACRAAHPAGDGARGPGAASLRRAGAGGVRAAGLRGVRGHHPAVAGIARGGGRSWPARGDAATHDPRRSRAHAAAPSMGCELCKPQREGGRRITG